MKFNFLPIKYVSGGGLHCKILRNMCNSNLNYLADFNAVCSKIDIFSLVWVNINSGIPKAPPHRNALGDKEFSAAWAWHTIPQAELSINPVRIHMCFSKCWTGHNNDCYSPLFLKTYQIHTNLQTYFQLD